MKRIKQRFEQLAAMAEEIGESKATGTTQKQIGIDTPRSPASYKTVKTYSINGSLLTQWRSSVEGLIVQVFGREHPHFQNFTLSLRGSTHDVFEHRLAIFRAARDDYEGGFLFDLRSMIHAEVFSDELEQAQSLLDNGYKALAAVVTGVVLETTLKELCKQNNIGIAKVNRMNADLAKEGVYNKTRQDLVQAWAKIRNSAAHGDNNEFSEGEVANMITGVREFIATVMT